MYFENVCQMEKQCWENSRVRMSKYWDSQWYSNDKNTCEWYWLLFQVYSFKFLVTPSGSAFRIKCVKSFFHKFIVSDIGCPHINNK